MELRRPLRAVASAACAASLLEILAAYARGSGHHPGYYGATFLASLALAAGVALILGPLGKVCGALAGWVLVASGLVHGIVAGALLSVWVALVAGRPGVRRIPESRLGLVLGASFAVAALFGLRAAPHLPADWPAALVPAIGFVVLSFFGLRLAARLPAFRSRFVLATLAILLVPGIGFGIRAERMPAAEPHGGTGPHVFLLVLDTVRADHLSVYGYDRDTTPRLSVRLASHAGALVHPWAFSNGSWTAPSHATLLTGLLPSQHEVHLGTTETRSMDWSMPTRFALKADRTLPERFREAGYATLAVFANPWLERIEGMDRGFDAFRSVTQKSRLPLVGERMRSHATPSLFLEVADFTAPAKAVARELLEAIDAARGRNLFVLANFLDAHAPYRPPPGARGRYAPWSPFESPQTLAADQSEAEKARLMARYDESLHALDAQLDAFLDALEARGILENAWVFITSDHGEAFGEHGVTDHGTGVYNEIVRVPLIVLPPAGAVLRPSAAPVSLATIAATAAAIAGVPFGADADLRSEAPGPAVVEFYADPAKARRHGALGAEPAQVLVAGDRKLIRYRDRSELYDLRTDPDETRDLSAQDPEAARALGEALPMLDWTRADSATADDDDAALRSRLEALGYLEPE